MKNCNTMIGQLLQEILRYEEILRIVRVVAELGISKVRITGGEPLVRGSVCDFLKQLTKIDGLRDVSLTTNGVLLERPRAPLANCSKPGHNSTKPSSNTTPSLIKFRMKLICWRCTSTWWERKWASARDKKQPWLR